MKTVTQNHPTGLALLAVTLLVALGRQLGLDIDNDTAYELVVAVGLAASALSPRFKRRFGGGATPGQSPDLRCIGAGLSDEPQSFR